MLDSDITEAIGHKARAVVTANIINDDSFHLAAVAGLTHIVYTYK